jgi:hypothetical protein
LVFAVLALYLENGLEFVFLVIVLNIVNLLQGALRQRHLVIICVIIKLTMHIIILYLIEFGVNELLNEALFKIRNNGNGNNI